MEFSFVVWNGLDRWIQVQIIAYRMFVVMPNRDGTLLF